jgi:aryl sulfotransferase
VPIYSSAVQSVPIHYISPDEDSSRWIDFPFREGDIVISARSKTGTTWLQMICALLVFQTPELPDSLSRLSPWLDWLIAPRADVYQQLADQDHRRFIKTHTPLDGLPVDARVTYVVTGRHPLDTAVSLYHHRGNLNRERIRELAGQPGSGPIIDRRPPLHQWLLGWIEQDVDPKDSLDSLPGVMWHLTDAWNRRAAQEVVFVHYDDLVHDLDAEMRHLASRLGISVPEQTWPALVEAATFAQMRARAASIAPDPSDILKDQTAFFRRGSSGAAAETLSPVELDRYYLRASTMAPPDALAWLHHWERRVP